MDPHRLRALNYLARREHSRVELSRKLSRYADAAEITPVLDELAAQGLLSHARFVESAHRVWYAKGYGPRWMLARFAQLGVTSDEVTSWWLTEQPDWVACARRVYQKKFPQAVTSFADRAKRIRFLIQRGFPQDIIHSVIGVGDECESG
ncbi:MAG: hypothetical protein A3J38_04035 [Gammaproteobacteria bacterium RIFCSPHIGHO2_12_FULL_45_9]|nr:MAG: hypothetical protein A3J38_04035 [Gammaproteobacteria bacterium RIFCSPHIGHO2_12_FULL_45_9]